jgi:hypothetical protein
MGVLQCNSLPFTGNGACSTGASCSLAPQGSGSGSCRTFILTLIEAPQEVRRIGYVEIGRPPRRGLDRDEFQASGKSVAIGHLTWAFCDILCAWPRGTRLRAS